MQSTERLINLIAFLLSTDRPVSADEIRVQVAGYDPRQRDDAFQRMFERDKDDLRDLGIPLLVGENDAGGAGYSIDASAYYLPPIEVEADEALALRIATRLLAVDPGFPLRDEIRSALAKLACDCDPPDTDRSSLVLCLAPEAASGPESENLARLRHAVEARKTVEFDYYSISSDGPSLRTVEPYGLFNAGGHWYVVGLCHDAQRLRTFRLSRIQGAVTVNSTRAKEPDFEVPPDFDVADHVRAPWEIGERSFEVRLRFEPRLAGWARAGLAGLARSVATAEDGALEIALEARDEQRLLRWVLSFGTGVTIVDPPALRSLARDRLNETLRRYEAGRS